AAFCELSFLLAIKITSKLSNFILHQFGGLHKLWDAPPLFDKLSFLNLRTGCFSSFNIFYYLPYFFNQ
ncbi:hypothetical protein DW977_05610, partial [Ruminococcus sp. AM49-10BH]